MDQVSKIGRSEYIEFAMVSAGVLIFTGLKRDETIWFTGAFFVVLAALLVPIIFKPLAIVWHMFSRILGKIMSQVVLVVVYSIVLVPVGFAMRIFGSDSLRIRNFKRSDDSVFTTRDYRFSARDFKNPF